MNITVQNAKFHMIILFLIVRYCMKGILYEDFITKCQFHRKFYTVIRDIYPASIMVLFLLTQESKRKQLQTPNEKKIGLYSKCFRTSIQKSECSEIYNG